MMALDHLNDASDGHWDTLLPNCTLEAYVYDSKRDDGNAVVNAFNLWKDNSVKALVGPASSSPSSCAAWADSSMVSGGSFSRESARRAKRLASRESPAATATIPWVST